MGDRSVNMVRVAVFWSGGAGRFEGGCPIVAAGELSVDRGGMVTSGMAEMRRLQVNMGCLPRCF